MFIELVFMVIVIALFYVLWKYILEEDDKESMKNLALPVVTFVKKYHAKSVEWVEAHPKLAVNISIVTTLLLFFFK